MKERKILLWTKQSQVIDQIESVYQDVAPTRLLLRWTLLVLKPWVRPLQLTDWVLLNSLMTPQSLIVAICQVPIMKWRVICKQELSWRCDIDHLSFWISIHPMKIRSGTNASFKNRSSESVHLKKRSTASLIHCSWSFFETYSFTWLIFETHFTWSVFQWKDRFIKNAPCKCNANITAKTWQLTFSLGVPHLFLLRH